MKQSFLFENVEANLEKVMKEAGRLETECNAIPSHLCLNLNGMNGIREMFFSREQKSFMLLDAKQLPLTWLPLCWGYLPQPVTHKQVNVLHPPQPWTQQRLPCDTALMWLSLLNPFLPETCSPPPTLCVSHSCAHPFPCSKLIQSGYHNYLYPFVATLFELVA